MKRVFLKSLIENQARINAVRSTMIYGRNYGVSGGTSRAEARMIADSFGVYNISMERARGLRRWFKYKR